MTFAPCDAAGKTYQVEAFGREEPAEPADGQLFLKVEDADHPWRYDSTLEMYSKNSGSWTAIPLEYCRITAAGLGKLFRQWDTVTVQGAAAEAAGQSPELNVDQIVYDVGEDWLRVRCTPQGEYFYGTLVQNAAAAQWQSMDGKQRRSVEAAQTVSMERRVPELDFVTECDNRVWGCQRAQKRKSDFGTNKKNVDLSRTLQRQEIRGLDSEGVTTVILLLATAVPLSFSEQKKTRNSLDILPALKGGDSQVANVPCEGEPSSYGYSLMRQCPASVY